MPRATLPFTIQGCTVADSYALPKNNVPAFFTNSNWRLIWTRVNKDCAYVISQASLRFAHSQLLSNPARKRHQKVVDSTGQIVGYCRWLLPEGVDDGLWPEARVPGVSEEEAATAKKEFDAADWNFDHSLDAFDDPCLEIKNGLKGKKNYFLLDYLAVHPDYQRQGIGLMLVESGLEEAEKMRFDTFVSACSDGKGVYERAGFVLLDQIIQDDTEWGGDGAHASYFLEKTVENAVNLAPVVKSDE